jgi:Protein of unknown function (DUF3352)
MVAMQEPISGDLTPFHPKPRRRRPWWLFVAPIAVVATATGGYMAMTPAVSQLNGLNLMPANTIMVAQIAIDRSDWLRLKAMGTPASRAILERELAKWSQETFGDTNLLQSIPPWLGKEIYWARLSTGDNLALLSIRNNLPVQPGNQRQYQGVTVWETAKESRAVIASKDEKFLAIGSKTAIEQAIVAQKGQNLSTSPIYTQMNKVITGGDSIAQVYVNLPQMIGSKSTTKLTSQALLMNISTKDQVLAAKGVVWSNKKLVPSQHSPGFATQVPASTMLLLSGSSLGKLWAEYLPLAANNPAAPIQPQMLQDSLKSSTGLDLNTNILAWGSGEFALAVVPQTPAAQAQILSGSVGGAVLLLSRSTDPAATDQTMSSLDKIMADRYKFKVDKTNVKDRSIVRWSAALGGTQATHGWLPNQVAFLTLGVPIAEQFLPNPEKSLENHADFRQVMSGGISPIAFGASKVIDAQVYIDVDKMATSGNLPLQKFPPDTQTILQAINSIGLVSNAVSDQANRFDLAIYLKSVAK